jgi:hypothetical protein
MAGRRQCAKGVGNDAAARLTDTVAPMLVPCWIRPQVTGTVGDCGDCSSRGQWRQFMRISGEYALPLRLGRPEGHQDRVVEIEQDRSREARHGAACLTPLRPASQRAARRGSLLEQTRAYPPTPFGKNVGVPRTEPARLSRNRRYRQSNCNTPKTLRRPLFATNANGARFRKARIRRSRSAHPFPRPARNPRQRSGAPSDGNNSPDKTLAPDRDRPPAGNGADYPGRYKTVDIR